MNANNSMNSNNLLLEGSTLPTLSAQDYLAILRRRRRVILAFSIVALILAVIIAVKTKPVYQATATLLVDASATTNTIDAADPIASLMAPSSPQTVETQVKMLQATPLLSEVSDQTGVPLEELANHLAVTNADATNVIEVTAELRSGEAAAGSVNLLLNDYLQQQKQADQANVEDAYNYLSRRKVSAWAELLKAQGALRFYKERHHLSDLDRNRDNLLENISALRTDYQTDLSSISGLQSRIRAEKALLAKEPSVFEITLRATNTAIQTDRDEISRLLEQKATLTQPGGYKESAPAVQAINGQIAQLRRDLAAQPALTSTVAGNSNSVRQDLNNRLTEDQSNLANLQSNARTVAQQLVGSTSQVQNYPEYASALALLDGNVQTAQAAYDLYNAKSASLSIRRQTYRPHASILELASVPNVPVAPKKGQIIAFGLGIGLFLGLITALLLEFGDDRIYTLREAGILMDTIILGRIPLSKAPAVSAKASLPVPPAYRELRTNLSFLAMEVPFKTVAVMAASPGETASYTVAQLARAFAIDGKRVLSIDGNLRRSVQSSSHDASAGPGLSDVLTGKCPFNTAILPTDVENLSLMSAGTPVDHSIELLGSPAMSQFLKLARARADMVLFDLPSIQDASDARVVAAQVDGALLLIDCRRTKKSHALRARALLSHARIRLLGIVWQRDDGRGDHGPLGIMGMSKQSQRSVTHPQDADRTLVMERTLISPLVLHNGSKQESTEEANRHE